MAPAYAKSESSEKTQKLEQISVSDQTDLLNLEKIFSDLSSQKKVKNRRTKNHRATLNNPPTSFGILMTVHLTK